MQETIKLSIKISDEGGFKQIEVEAESLRSALQHIKKEAHDLNGAMVNWSQSMQALEGLRNAVSQLSSSMSEGIRAFSQHEIANQKLANNMRNTMDATESEVQGILRLAEAQQQLGVISDDIQIAGAQELATYLRKKESLEQLIPVMNDMLAQQYGLEASQESAAQIAAMLGKVMEGQVEALSRYGYKFDETQKQILQFGSEEERVATLAEVVESSVGGMNQALAQTDSGKAHQMAERFEDLKETLGEITVSFAPFVGLMDTIASIGTGLGQIVSTVKAFSTVISTATLKTKLMTLHTKAQTAAQRMLSACMGTTTVSTWALNAAVTALYATLTMGVALAITALAGLLSDSGDAAEEAADKTDILKESTTAFTDSVRDAQASIWLDISNLKNLTDANGDVTKTVSEMNRKYGESMGYHRNAAEWYNILVAHSKTYCKQLGYEAQAKVLANQIAAKQLRRDELQDITKGGLAARGVKDAEKRKEIAAQVEEMNRLNGEIKELEANYEKAINSMAEAGKEMANMSQTAHQTSIPLAVEKMTLSELSRAIEANHKRLLDLAPEEIGEIRRLREMNEQLKKRKDHLETMAGIKSPAKTQSPKEKETVNIEDPHTVEELSAAIAHYEAMLAKTNPAEREAISALAVKVQQLKASKTAIEDQIRVAAQSEELDTLKAIDDAILLQQQLRQTASKEQLAAIEQELNRLNDLRTGLEDAAHPPLPTEQIETYRQLADALDYYNRKLETATEDQRTAIYKQIKMLNALRKKWDDTGDAILGTSKNNQQVTQTGNGARDAMQGLGTVMQNLGQAVSGSAASWLSWGANLMQAIAAAIPAIDALIDAHRNQATANAAAAATGAASSQASIPYVGPILAIAAVASVLAALANLPKFANGGLAYGPTLGIFGEYSGASNNPEVVAPLSKLKDIIGSSSEGVSGRVEFKQRGRYLRGVLEREEHLRSRG
ncbi:MAG: hypothetical protein K6E86_02075 [Bacteroidales bacterium]|nr:hypothetical protein [Bacteroidales bacterium]